MPLPAFAAIAVVASLVTFYAAGGHVLFADKGVPAAPSEAVAAAPSQPAPSLTHKGFSLDKISTRIDTQSGRPVFVIRGEVTNSAATPQIVPAVIVSFKNPQTGVVVSHTIPRGEILRAGERMGFVTRIPSLDGLNAEPTVTLAGN